MPGSDLSEIDELDLYVSLALVNLAKVITENLNAREGKHDDRKLRQYNTLSHNKPFSKDSVIITS